jgi:hypothetical protein
VQEHEGDVVPILREASPVGGVCLR